VGQAAILAGNHPSGLVDPMVLMTALPDLELSSVAKHSLFSTPVVSFFIRALRTVPVAKVS
jgi:1-acyl-sn-glycerol-3-phosphate acyltransferase